MKAIRAYALAFPILLPVAIFTMWFGGRLSLGHWPRPSLDDPGQIGGWFQIPYAFVGLLLSVGFPAFGGAVLALLYCAYRDSSRRKALLRASGCSLLLMVLAISVLWFEPFEVLSWYFD